MRDASEPSVSARRVMGVDGCPGGWIAVLRGSDGRAEVVRAALFAELAAVPDVDVIAVDMPVGLPERIGPAGRGPEAALRPKLGGRQSAVFSVPSRSAVFAAEYRAACDAASATSDPPRKVSKQAFFLFPKIREIDVLLRSGDGALRMRVFECHPEGAFAAMNGEPLDTPKKVKSRPHGPGLDARRTLLAEVAGFDPDFLRMPPPRGAASDDLLDACACLWTAERLRDGLAVPHPAVPDRDAHGLSIAIWT